MGFEKNRKKGYTLRYRSIYEWYQNNESLDIYALAVYDYLITFANKKPNAYHEIKIRPGQLIRSYQQIADALKISRATVIRKMAVLKKDGVVDYHKVEFDKGTSTLITVKRFEKYQMLDKLESKEERSAPAINEDKIPDLDKLLNDLD